CVHLPLVGRVIPIVEDDYVVMPLAAGADPEAAGVDPKARYATGFLKVTPAHDPNDWEIGVRHGLAVINVMAPDASISDKHGWTDVGGAEMFVGMPREIARREVVNEFTRRGLLEEKKPYRHGVGHSYRSHAPIEPYLSDQWYVRVTDERLAGSALAAMAADQRTGEAPEGSGGHEGDGALRFYPARYAKTYETWHRSIRDWCVSRQLWWGHRIPVWSLIPNVAGIKKGEMIDDSDYVEAQFLDALEGSFLAYCEAAGVKGDVCLVRESPRQWWACPRTDAAAAALQALERVMSARLLGEEGVVSGVVRDELAAAGLSRCAEPASALVAGLMFCEQEQDVLDTWFSSGLWPLSTLGWPDATKELAAFNPSSVLCTAREIITLWVSRMVMFNRYFRGQDAGAEGAGRGPVPFRDVFIHAMIQDEQGRKMSKSLGNGVDPLDIIASHGADAMRFTLCQMTTNTQDVRMPVDLVCPHCGEVFTPGWKRSTRAQASAEADGLLNVPDQTCPGCGKGMVTLYGAFSGIAPASAERPQARNTSSKFDLGRNFANKLWNAARFTLSMLPTPGEAGAGGGGGESAPIDRWMLSRLARAVGQCEAALKGYEFSAYAEALYDLVWRDFCDVYLEAIKPTVAGSAPQRAVLRAALETILRLAHPVMPFVTEAIHEQVRGLARAEVPGVILGESRLLARAGWPRLDAGLVDAALDGRVERMRALVGAINQARAARGVPPKRRVVLHTDGASGVRGLVEEFAAPVAALAGLRAVTAEGAGPGAATLAVPFEAMELRLSDLADAVDAGAEAERLVDQLIERQRDVARLQSRLESPGYAQRAPAHLVEQSKQQLGAKVAERDALVGTIRSGGIAAAAAGRLRAKVEAAGAVLASLAGQLPDPADPPKQLTPAQKKAKEQAAAASEERDAAAWALGQVG
ncbi:MAG: class I tRNA ligase family protein, partial [Phycisphaerae bacterium]|nr:class I tRNA ligase family protein [Phycisphaerae bacterium]